MKEFFTKTVVSGNTDSSGGHTCRTNCANWGWVDRTKD